jgi:hypothetical protein
MRVGRSEAQARREQVRVGDGASAAAKWGGGVAWGAWVRVGDGASAAAGGVWSGRIEKP